MVDELNSLIRKRGAIKARQTLFKKFLDSVQISVSQLKKNEILDSKVITELESRLTKQETLFEEFQDCQSAIEILHNDLEEQISERELFENSHFKLIAVCKQIVSNHAQVNFDENDNSFSQVDSLHSDHHLTGGVKLPQIELPKFQGDYEKWLEFRDTYLSLIHKNPEISDISKFHYLKAQLQGNAKQVLHALDISKENYKIAWESLCERYDNTRLLVYNHLRSLVDAPNLSNGTSVDMRKMIDTISKHLRALESLKQPVIHWDTLLIFLLSRKLDKNMEQEWEKAKNRDELPTIKEFKEFLKGKADLLETLEYNHKDNKQVQKNKTIIQKQSYSSSFKGITKLSNQSFNTTAYSNCVFCKGTHYIQNCKDFLKLPNIDRVQQANNLKLCTNCLRDNHFAKYCRSGHCRICRLKHNTLLHIDNDNNKQSGNNLENLITTKQPNIAEPFPSTSQSNQISMSSHVNHSIEVLLSTALIQVKDYKGHYHTCRALLDSGSQSNLITSDLCKKLGLEKTSVHLAVVGIGQAVSNISDRCSVLFHSLHNKFELTISCLILSKISENVPSAFVNISSLDIPPHIRLADPCYNTPGPIDILLGAGLFYRLLSSGQISLGPQQPVLQKTCLGWVISGPVATTMPIPKTYCNFSSENDIQQQLSKFWELEEPPLSCSSIHSKDEQACELNFVETVSRDENGRFIVTIPLKESPTLLGDSKHMALSRFHSMEAKLWRNPTLKKMYCDFMSEYEQLGHMSQIDEQVQCNNSQIAYFLPHHGVLNEKSLTTKLRVVFDGSAPSDSGWSLNDLQLVGPTIQDDLLSIILRFRQHNIVICADVEKMYRQVSIHPSQRSLQQILWRSDPSKELNTFQLNTITYGTSSAAFLAVRCLSQLAIDNLEKYPQASEVISHDFYVDDLLSGAETVEEAIKLGIEVSTILQTAGFNLRKWISNSATVLNKISSNSSSANFQFNEKDGNKTLGLYWSCKSDVLMFAITECSKHVAITKRTILSDIAQIFDPLGLLSPCIIIAKIILQKLWSYKLTWDETLPCELHSKWQNLRLQLSNLNQLQIPRRVICQNAAIIELHGFSDSSSEAYGANVYIRSISHDNNIQVSLLCSKSKVAPLKPLTIPRLELCASLVLVRLMNKVTKSIKLHIDNVHLWSDSTVVLHWIQTSPNLLQTFVANRVVQIQAMSDLKSWHHVRSDDNPADLLSRGVTPDKLQVSALWWHGPDWLALKDEYWPNSNPTLEETLPELKKVKVFISNQGEQFPFERFSNFIRLKRVTAFCMRFSFNCKHNQNRRVGPLTTDELHYSLQCLLKAAQRQCFSNEIYELNGKTQATSKKNLLGLNPFLDSQGILRVGGRLQLSKFDYSKKHPVLLSSKHTLTKLIFKYEHIRLMHAGPLLLLSSIREHYWPLSGRNLARKIVHDCVRCYRTNPKQTNPLMGVLPSQRVQPMPAFHISGIDYIGPFLIKDKKGRGSKTSKCYISLFICFVTKAIHLEAVTNLTTEAFIAAFRRFTSRRGKPHTVYSDNGKNFVGAQSELQSLGEFLSKNEQSLSDCLATESINWKFIPAYSPHFGGLWEAGVKSSKFHLKRVMSNAMLTFEEFYTTLTQIEAILNSRPLTPLSPDPNDYNALTPAHFLIGRQITSLPDPSLIHIKESRLSRFQRVQQLQHHFWERWTKEYVSELQTRTKWKTNQLQLQAGTLVVVKQDNVPPLQWLLGRIVQIHPGPDGIARVASIKTHSGVIKRAFSKICVLPIEYNDCGKV